MRYQPLIIAAVTCAWVVAASVPSLARPPARGPEIAQRAEHERALAQLRHARIMRETARRQLRTASVTAPRAADRNRLVGVPVAARSARPAFGWPALVSEARKYIGTNPTARSRLWCATFMNFVLAKTGYSGTGSDAARSFASYGKRIAQPRVGAIAVLTRGRNGGHVGVVTGIDKSGNPIIISGNHGRRVGEATYPRGRVIAYVMPVGHSGQTRVAAAAPAAKPVRPPGREEGEVVSPITELLAAINAEKAQPPRHSLQAVARAVQPPQRARRVVARASAPPAVRERLVQQMPEAPRASPQATSRSVLVRHALSELFGVRSANAEPRR